uniref:CLASP_N domain-containing protein n=1 Tax=Ascaris lumbricoides TaxID=6252 RepID=A0A0M3I7K1_ASCLU
MFWDIKLTITDIKGILNFSCQLQLVITLQGADVDATTRHLLAMSIAEMDSSQKTEIAGFLTQIAIPAAMENNACKVFECATDELDKALTEENVALLVALWKRTLTEIIPTMQAMLYPLKAFDASFDIRREILKAFRDRVLLRILSDVRFGLPTLRSMICSVSFATADDSVEFERFSEIADRILGMNQEKEIEGEEMVKLKKIAKTRLSVPHSIGNPRERMYVKKRAATMPCSRRMVHFSDDAVNDTVKEDRTCSFE